MRLCLFLVTLLALSACRDRASDAGDPLGADSVLARDIALAGADSAVPQFADSALLAGGDSVRRPVPPPRAVQRSTRPTPATVRAPVTIAPAPPLPAPVPAPRGIAAGTTVRLTTTRQVCTNTSRPGDRFIATITEPVVGENGVSFPAGSRAVVEVVSVNKGGRPEDATITMRVRSVTVSGVVYPVRGDVSSADTLVRTRTEASKGTDKRRVVAGAIAGAVLGQVIGKDTKATVIGAAAGAAAGTASAARAAVYDGCLPSGASLRLLLAETVAPPQP